MEGAIVQSSCDNLMMKTPQPDTHDSGFTLVELLVVIAVVVTLTATIAPAFMGINNAGNVTRAAYDVAGALNSARAYAMAKNTYVWVGFFEENAAQPFTSGTGRVVMSIVASKDGTMAAASGTIPSASLTQINKLVKIDNMHLTTAGIAQFPVGDGTGMAFDSRPLAAQVWPTNAASGSSQAPFQYPVGNGATAQYTFNTAIQFSPRGEVQVRVNNASQPVQPVVEIGLQPAHGTVPDANSKNLAAVQITGIAGNVKIYRR